MKEFMIPRLNDTGLATLDEVSQAFQVCLDRLKSLVPTNRDAAFITIKMQEAHSWALRALASERSNQL